VVTLVAESCDPVLLNDGAAGHPEKGRRMPGRDKGAEAHSRFAMVFEGL